MSLERAIPLPEQYSGKAEDDVLSMEAKAELSSSALRSLTCLPMMSASSTS